MVNALETCQFPRFSLMITLVNNNWKGGYFVYVFFMNVCVYEFIFFRVFKLLVVFFHESRLKHLKFIFCNKNTVYNQHTKYSFSYKQHNISNKYNYVCVYTSEESQETFSIIFAAQISKYVTQDTYKPTNNHCTITLYKLCSVFVLKYLKVALLKW